MALIEFIETFLCLFHIFPCLFHIVCCLLHDIHHMQMILRRLRAPPRKRLKIPLEVGLKLKISQMNSRLSPWYWFNSNQSANRKITMTLHAHNIWHSHFSELMWIRLKNKIISSHEYSLLSVWPQYFQSNQKNRTWVRLCVRIKQEASQVKARILPYSPSIHPYAAVYGCI